VSSFSIFHWLIAIAVIGLPVALLVVAVFAIKSMFKPGLHEIANTWKGRTFLFAGLAVLVPLWLITLPLFAYLAHKSYKEGSPPGTPVVPPQAFNDSTTIDVPATPSSGASVASRIAELHALLQAGALTQDEFDQQKRKILTA
jgi:H+/gluconate symporter-like permease